MNTGKLSLKSTALATTSAAAVAIACSIGFAGIAVAQDDDGVEERIVVTGSRIQRRDFEANSPIVTVESETFENRSSFNVEAALNQLPQFVPDGSQNLGSAAGTPFPDAAAAPGAATLNLRGLGSNRSLVLVNGRRPQPVNSQLVVDVNSIPAAAIENVEVITGGAAAVYGADAIAGVVNFRLRNDFEGFELDTQYGVTEQGDNEETQVSALIGGNFDDGRGNAMAGVVWSQRGDAFQRDREFYTRGWLDPLTQGAAVAQSRPGIVSTDIDGVLWGVNPDGSLFQVNNALDPANPYTGPLNQLANGAGFKIDGQGQLDYNDPDNQIGIPSTRYSAFAAARYDINDSVTAFLEANYMENQTSALSLVPPAFNIWAISIPYDPANDDPDSPTFGATPTNFHPVSAPLADLLNSRATPDANWSMTRSLDFLGRLRTDTTSNIYQVTTGFQGELPYRDWTFEVYGSHGKTSVVAFQPSGSISQENLTQIIAGTATAGFPTATGPWSAGWTNGEVIAVQGSCESGIPLFNPDGSVPDQVTVSQDCIDYSTLKLNSLTQLEQNIVEATVQGGLFDMPFVGEEIRFAAGATYREAGFMFNPDSGFSAQQMRANVINLIALPLYTEGSLSVAEIYGELLVPLVRDVPGVQSLDLELGYRYSDYDAAGGVDTYKILGDWAVNDWLRFRGGYQRANRAPNIFELYAPISAGLAFGTNDPCTNIDNFSAAYGNVPGNPDRANVQLACAELIERDGGFAYNTLQDDPNPGQAVDDPDLDLTHLSNFRNTVLGYNVPFAISIALEQGNSNLESEVADTFTFGFVLNSPFDHPLTSGASLSVDWYQIEIDGTIATPSYSVIYSQCLDAQFNPRIGEAPGTYTGADLLAGSPYCDLINREPVSPAGGLGELGSGLDRNFNAAFVNLGGTETSGIDVQFNWSADFADMGAMQNVPGGLNFNLVGSFLSEFAEAPFPGADFVDFKGTVQNSAYDYKLFSTLGYNVGGVSTGLRVRYLPEIDPLPTATPGTQGANSHTELDLFGRWLLNDTVELRGGIDNLLDEQPEVVGRTPTDNALGTTNQNYDVLGRRFYVGATLRY